MDNGFLILSLFLPRITILVYYFFAIQYPVNSVPFIADVLLTMFLPRVLILIYIADYYGTSSPWFWIHLVVALIVWFTGGKWYSVRRRKRKARFD